MKCEFCGGRVSVVQYGELSKHPAYQEDNCYIVHKHCVCPDDKVIETTQSLALVEHEWGGG